MIVEMRIALAGNPNSGKTTLFNALTGSNQFVGNWPGVTVEKKEGKLKKHADVHKRLRVFSSFYYNTYIMISQVKTSPDGCENANRQNAGMP